MVSIQNELYTDWSLPYYGWCLNIELWLHLKETIKDADK